jgi:hypothetical protein
LLICVGVVIWTQTPAGRQWLDDLATTVVVMQTATAEAGGPAVGTPVD